MKEDVSTKRWNLHTSHTDCQKTTQSNTKLFPLLIKWNNFLGMHRSGSLENEHTFGRVTLTTQWYLPGIKKYACQVWCKSSYLFSRYKRTKISSQFQFYVESWFGEFRFEGLITTLHEIQHYLILYSVKYLSC